MIGRIWRRILVLIFKLFNPTFKKAVMYDVPRVYFKKRLKLGERVHINDSVFINDYYADYQYFDFRLDSLSPARAIADSTVAKLFPFDLLGNPRTTWDAGCYVYTEQQEEE